MAEIGRAYELATIMHYGQTDKIGEPYILHLVRVSEAVTSALTDYKVTALLHDVLEDTDCDQNMLAALFNPRVVEAVIALTKIDGEPYVDYLERVRRNEMARIVKIADIQDNLLPRRLDALPGAIQDRLRAKYNTASHILSQPNKE